MDALALRPAEAAKAVGLSRSKFYELLRNGEVRALKVGAVTLIRTEDLRVWLDAQAALSEGA